eukprot:9145743-Pyramimonas_sp.AAC.1
MLRTCRLWTSKEHLRTTLPQCYKPSAASPGLARVGNYNAMSGSKGHLPYCPAQAYNAHRCS